MVKKITGNIKFSCKKPIEIIRSDAEKENIIKNWNDCNLTEYLTKRTF